MITKGKAINSLVPTAEFAVRGDDVEWINPTTAPVTDAQIDAEIARLQAEYDAKQYQRDRASAYPSIQEQLDMLWHSVNNGTDLKNSDWFNQLSSVKQAHPKGQ